MKPVSIKDNDAITDVTLITPTNNNAVTIDGNNLKTVHTIQAVSPTLDPLEAPRTDLTESAPPASAYAVGDEYTLFRNPSSARVVIAGPKQAYVVEEEPLEREPENNQALCLTSTLLATGVGLFIFGLVYLSRKHHPVPALANTGMEYCPNITLGDAMLSIANANTYTCASVTLATQNPAPYTPAEDVHKNDQYYGFAMPMGNITYLGQGVVGSNTLVARDDYLDWLQRDSQFNGVGTLESLKDVYANWHYCRYTFFDHINAESPNFISNRTERPVFLAVNNTAPCPKKDFLATDSLSLVSQNRFSMFGQLKSLLMPVKAEQEVENANLPQFRRA